MLALGRLAGAARASRQCADGGREAWRLGRQQLTMMLRSCHCCDLRNGALAVAIVFLSLSVAEFLGVLIGWGAADATRAFMDRYSSQRDYSYHYSYLPGVEILIPLSILFIVQLAFDVLLLVGIVISRTRRSSARCYLVSWIIFRAIFFGIFSLGSFGLLVTAIISRYSSGGEYLSVVFGGCFVLTAVISGLFWYSWVVVLSFYWQLRESETTGVIYNRMQMETATLETGQPAATEAAPSGSWADGAGQSRGQKSA